MGEVVAKELRRARCIVPLPNRNANQACFARGQAPSVSLSFGRPTRRLAASRVAYNSWMLVKKQPASPRQVVPAAKSTETPPRRILAVDYGRKRMGLALSDELGLTAQPLATLTRTNRQDDLRRLREICRMHGVARVIVGHPLHITGETSAMSDEASRFADRLRKALRIAVELHDERLTTWEAEQTMTELAP